MAAEMNSPKEVVDNINVVWQTITVIGGFAFSVIGAMLTGYGLMLKKIVNMTLSKISETQEALHKSLMAVDGRVDSVEEAVDKANKAINKTREALNLVIYTHNKEKQDSIHQVKEL